jgi:hypothetical protein
MENYRVNTWGRQFLYQTVNISNLDSAFLDNNEKFQDMKRLIGEFNEEVIPITKSL